MASSDQPVRHHHVPAFYLGQWANSAEEITVSYRRKDGIQRTTKAPESVGFERHLWSLSEARDGDRQPLERDFFAPLDGAASAILRKLLSMHDQPTPAEAAKWAKFLQSLHIRVPAHVHHVRGRAPPELEGLLSAPDPEFDRMKGDHPAQTPAEFLRMEAPHIFVDAGVEILRHLVENTDAHRTILMMRWLWRRLPCSAPPLITSDKPLILMRGLYDPKCLLALPLSPRHVFFASAHLPYLQRVCDAPASLLARSMNESVASQATRFVVGNCEERFLAVRWGFATRR